jgi:hypothetical protein
MRLILQGRSIVDDFLPGDDFIDRMNGAPHILDHTGNTVEGDVFAFKGDLGILNLPIELINADIDRGTPSISLSTLARSIILGS